MPALTLERDYDVPGSKPLARLDQGVRAGTLLRIVTNNAISNPNATGAMANGASLVNLADLGFANGTNLDGTTFTNNGSNGGITTAGAISGAAYGFSFGTGYDAAFDSDPDYMVSAMIKMSSASTGSNSNVLGLGTPTTNLFLIDGGSDNKSPRGGATTTSGSPISAFTGFTADTIHHLAITRERNVMKLWLNGAVVYTAVAKALPDLSASTLLLGNRRLTTTFYAVTIENTTLTAASEVEYGVTWDVAAAVAANRAADLAAGYV